MKTAIMQPYFFPYIGYFQLISSVDLFILYDNIKYTKRGWINRNRILSNGNDVLFTLPLRHGSDNLDVRGRELAADYNPTTLLNHISGSYRRAPYFDQVFPVIEHILRQDERNLFRFLYHSIATLCEMIGIATPLKISSSIDIDHGLKNQDKVLALCEAVGTDVYINAIGGTELYDSEDFAARGIELKFIRSKPLTYPQFDNTFIPQLSIIDVLMFNSRGTVRQCIQSNYELIGPAMFETCFTGAN